MTTEAPSWAKRRAMARPIPLEEPVTMMTLPERLRGGLEVDILVIGGVRLSFAIEVNRWETNDFDVNVDLLIQS